MSVTPPPPPPPQGDYPGYYPPPPLPSGPGTLAEWWRRALAILIDGLLIGIPLGIIGGMVGLADVVHDTAGGGQTLRYEAKPGLFLLSFVVTLAYFALLEGSPRGSTVGKMALHIQVRDATTGGPIGPGRALLRRFIYMILFYALFLPGLINVLSPLWDRRRQAWHDKAANSVVVISA